MVVAKGPSRSAFKELIKPHFLFNQSHPRDQHTMQLRGCQINGCAKCKFDTYLSLQLEVEEVEVVRAGDMVAKVGKWMVGQGERVEDLMDKEEEKSCHSATPKIAIYLDAWTQSYITCTVILTTNLEERVAGMCHMSPGTNDWTRRL